MVKPHSFKMLTPSSSLGGFSNFKTNSYPNIAQRLMHPLDKRKIGSSNLPIRTK